MPAPLSWKYSGIQSVTGQTLLQTLGSIATWLSTATQYNDGSPRTPGTGTAWQVAQQDGQSIILEPPSDAPTNTGRVLLTNGPITVYTSFTGSNTPANVVIGYVKDVPNGDETSYVLDGWDAANPYGTAYPYFFYRSNFLDAAGTIDRYAVIESTDAIAVIFISDTDDVRCALGGAFISVPSTDVLDAEQPEQVLVGMLTGNWIAGGNNFSGWFYPDGTAVDPAYIYKDLLEDHYERLGSAGLNGQTILCLVGRADDVFIGVFREIFQTQPDYSLTIIPDGVLVSEEVDQNNERTFLFKS